MAAFCPNCGSPVTGRFCPNCGTDVGTAANGGSTTAAPGASWSAVPPPPPSYAAGGLSENVASALCYALGFITGIIFLVLSPYNRNRAVRFHAWQSIFFNIAVLVIDWAVRILLYSLLHMGFIALGLMSVLHLLWFVLWLVLIISAFNRKTIKLPLVGDLAARQA